MWLSIFQKDYGLLEATIVWVLKMAARKGQIYHSGVVLIPAALLELRAGVSWKGSRKLYG